MPPPATGNALSLFAERPVCENRLIEICALMANALDSIAGGQI
jgi:hypothetical protein